MLGIILSIAIIGALLMAIYPMNFMKKKLFYDVDLSQIITLIVPVILFVLFFLYLALTLASNPRVNITNLPDNFFIILFGIFLGLGAAGNGIHFAAKCLSNYMKKHEKEGVRKASYFFHIHFGHHMVYIFIILLMALGIFFEFHHPSTSTLTNFEMVLIVLAGILMGLIWVYSISFSLVSKKGYTISSLIFSLIFLIIYLKSGLNIAHLPYSIFLFSALVVIGIFLWVVDALEKKNIHIIGKFMPKEVFSEHLEDKKHV